MAEEEDTREVLFPQWMGANKSGLTIEKSGEGEIFVKEVKDESPAAHTGRVHKGTSHFHFHFHLSHLADTFIQSDVQRREKSCMISSKICLIAACDHIIVVFPLYIYIYICLSV